jgi:TonB family protein
LITAVLGAVVIVALAWAGVRMIKSHGTQAPPAALQGSLPQTPDASAPEAADVAKSSAAMPANSGRSDVAASKLALHEEISEVSQSARRAIRGHVKVGVRIVIDPNGSVIAATADRVGRSRYFQRVAMEAARKWTFPAIDSHSRRVMQIHFDFSRDETTGRAVTLD